MKRNQLSFKFKANTPAFQLLLNVASDYLKANYHKVTSDCLYLLSCDRALGLDKTYSNSEDPEDEQSNQNDTPFSRLMDGKY